MTTNFRLELKESSAREVFFITLVEREERDGRVRRGEENMMSAWFTWVGLRVESRNCLDSMWLWSLTGMHFASECRWSIPVIFTQPVAVLRAAFCVVCSSFQLVSLSVGVQIGAA